MTWAKAFLSGATEGDRWVNLDRVDLVRVYEIAANDWRIQVVYGTTTGNLNGSWATEAEANEAAAKLVRAVDPATL